MIPFNHLGMVFNTFGGFIYPKSVRKSFCDFLQTLEPKTKILDIGAGTGMLCKFAHECRTDLELVAVDPAEGMMKYAETYVETHKGTAEKLPFEDNAFDVAMMGESLHHFREVDEALSETVRVLKEGGKLFIYDFDVASFKGKSICKMEMMLGEPGNFFDTVGIKEKLEAFGFVVEVLQHGWRYTVVGVLGK